MYAAVHYKEITCESKLTKQLQCKVKLYVKAISLGVFGQPFYQVYKKEVNENATDFVSNIV